MNLDQCEKTIANLPPDVQAAWRELRRVYQAVADAPEVEADSEALVFAIMAADDAGRSFRLVPSSGEG